LHVYYTYRKQTFWKNKPFGKRFKPKSKPNLKQNPNQIQTKFKTKYKPNLKQNPNQI